MKKRRAVKTRHMSGVLKFFLVILFITIVMIIWGVLYIYINNPLYKPPKVESEIENQATSHVYEKESNNQVDILYPTFNILYFDKIIENMINEKRETFDQKNEKYKELTDTTKADLKIGYKSYKISDFLVSVVFDISEREAFDTEYENRYVTYNFDLKNEKQISLNDLFKGRYLNYISSYIENELINKEGLDYEKLRLALYPSEENFSNFLLKDDRILFYFDKYSSVGMDLCVEIPYEDISEYIKRGYLESKVKKEDYLYDNISGPIDDRVPTVVLTFDDGPSKNTDDVVDILRKYNAVATFFMVGYRLDTVEDDVLKNLLEEGSTINSHSYDHTSFTKLSGSKIQKQVEDTANLIYEKTGYNIRFVRPPYGSYNDKVKQNCEYPLVNWSVDPRDWDTSDPDVVYENVMSVVEDGDVILLHETHDSTIEALPKILEKLNEMGYQTVTMEEMVDNLSDKLKRRVVIE